MSEMKDSGRNVPVDSSLHLFKFSAGLFILMKKIKAIIDAV